MLKKHSPQLVSLLLTICLAILFYTPQKAYALTETNTRSIAAIHKILNWEKENLHSNNSILSSKLISNAGTTEGDWFALALGRLGNQIDYDTYLTSLTTYTTNQYELHDGIISNKATDWHRLALTMLSLGGDPTTITYDTKDFSFSLIKEGTYDFTATDSLDTQGTNGLAYALITLDSMRYKIPKDSKYTREDLIEALFAHQNKDGGFSLDPSAKNSDPDLTAIVIQALSPYYNQGLIFQQKTARSVIDAALGYLSKMQTTDGSIKGATERTLESTAQTLLACTTLGINPATDHRFIKNNRTLLDGLLLYQQEDGGFSHVENETESNTISTQQALCALVSYVRYLNNNRTFYDMRPEISNKVKRTITTLEQQLSSLTTKDKETLKNLYSTYCSIPEEERSYVYHYYKLADAMEKEGLSPKPASLKDTMELNDHGSGSIYNIVAKEPSIPESSFTENDLSTYQMLSNPYNIDDYGMVISLLLKLKRTSPENYPSDCSSVISYENLLQNLEEEKSAIETMNVKIAQINGEIKDHLEPFNHITKKDKELVNRLIGETAALNKSAQDKIEGYDQLLAAYKKLNSNAKTLLIWVILCMLVLLLAVPIVITLYHKRNKKESVQ
ncbi:MAG: terpene cyclase/mutase family protein [bacterium]|nr:terpene cyclase/mutase family protein [bacterium]